MVNGIVLDLVNFILALVAVLLGLGIAWRLSGKMAVSYKLLVMAIVTFSIIEFTRLLYKIEVLSSEFLIDVMGLVFIILIVLSILKMKYTIREIDGHRNHEKKKK